MCHGKSNNQHSHLGQMTRDAGINPLWLRLAVMSMRESQQLSPPASVCVCPVAACDTTLWCCVSHLPTFFFLGALFNIIVERGRKWGGREWGDDSQHLGFELGPATVRTVASAYGASVQPTELYSTPALLNRPAHTHWFGQVVVQDCRYSGFRCDFSLTIGPRKRL